MPTKWALRGKNAWPKPRITEALKETAPLQVNLKQTVPIYIVYHTAAANDAGEVTFYKDLYDRNTELPAANAADVDVNKVR